MSVGGPCEKNASLPMSGGEGRETPFHFPSSFSAALDTSAFYPPLSLLLLRFASTPIFPSRGGGGGGGGGRGARNMTHFALLRRGRGFAHKPNRLDLTKT